MITRAQLPGRLTLQPGAPTTTYVLEVHAEAGPDLLIDMLGTGSVTATDDHYLFAASVGDGTFWVDQVDERFWSFHTDSIPARSARSLLKTFTERRRDVDRLWFPSAHLRNLWPGAVTRQARTSFRGTGLLGTDAEVQDVRFRLAGRDADGLLAYLEESETYRTSLSFDSVQASVHDDNFGRVEEGVSREGRFAAYGDSFELHVDFVRSMIRRYKRLVTLCESSSLVYSPFAAESDEGGGALTGSPIVVDFSRPIPDLEVFLSELLASREPFRLWGVPQVQGDHATVEAVDLHMGQRMRLEFGPQWMRVLLQPDSCGNTVVRLVSNLQHSFDGALSFRDPALHAALTADAP